MRPAAALHHDTRTQLVSIFVFRGLAGLHVAHGVTGLIPVAPTIWRCSTIAMVRASFGKRMRVVWPVAGTMRMCCDTRNNRFDCVEVFAVPEGEAENSIATFERALHQFFEGFVSGMPERVRAGHSGVGAARAFTAILINSVRGSRGAVWSDGSVRGRERRTGRRFGRISRHSDAHAGAF